MKSLKIVTNKNKKETELNGCVSIEYHEIDLIDDSTFNEVGVFVLDYLPYNQREEYITKCIKKLRIGGTFFVECNEYNAILKSIANNNINNVKALNFIIYAEGKMSIDTLKNLIHQVGKHAKVSNVGYSGETCWLKANRNE